MLRMKIIPLLPGMLLAMCSLFAEEQHDWENPKILGINKEPPHCTMMVYPDASSAVSGDRASSPYFQSLNGIWKFNWVKKPSDRPADFYRSDYNLENWHDIKVPSNWQMEGFGHPMFRNVTQTFKSDPPRVPKDYNPVGSYRRVFILQSGGFLRDNLRPATLMEGKDCTHPFRWCGICILSLDQRPQSGIQ